MRNETRIKYNAYATAIAQLSGVANAAEKFSVAPSVQQTLEAKIQESSEFLGRINLMPVNDQSGQKLGLGVGSPIASRTDTTKGERQTRDITTLDDATYVCSKTNYDNHLGYEKLDAWAKFPTFQARVRDAIVKRQALDRIMIGWNGLAAAADSNLVNNPLLQDVNKGWLQHLREYANGAKFMKEVKADSGVIKIGNGVAAADGYKNLDALVMDMVANLIEPWYQDDPDLVVVLGRGLLADKYFPLVNKDQNNTEKMSADLIISQKRVGGLQAVTVPYVPAGTLAISRLDNLSIYYQEGARRRALIDNPKRDRIENFESSNDAYVIEDFGCIAAAENIQIVSE